MDTFWEKGMALWTLINCSCLVSVNPGQHEGGNYRAAAINFTFIGNPVGQEIPLTPRVKAHGKVDHCNFLTTSVNSFHSNVPFL